MNEEGDDVILIKQRIMMMDGRAKIKKKKKLKSHTKKNKSKIKKKWD